jgi:hypothetical protein
MVQITWREAALAAGRIASRHVQRCKELEDAWPDESPIPMPVDDGTNLSLEDKIDFLREKGLYDILFRNAGVGLMFYLAPMGIPIEEFPNDSWKQHLYVHSYYPTFDEAVEAEYLRRVTSG